MYDSYNDGDTPSTYIAVTPLTDAFAQLPLNVFMNTNGIVQYD